MLPGPPVKLICPHCKGHKYIQSISTGNTFRAQIWSDWKHVYPMLPQPFPIQKCSNCGKYYFYADSISHPSIKRHLKRFQEWIMDGVFNLLMELSEGEIKKEVKEDPQAAEEEKSIFEESYQNGFGDLSFDEMNEAFESLYSDKLPEKRKEILIVKWLYAFNDRYNGRNGEQELPDIPMEIQTTRNWIVAEILKRIKNDQLMTAEMLRENGQFDDCISIITRVIESGKENLQFARDILEHAQKQDRRVFLLCPKSL